MKGKRDQTELWKPPTRRTFTALLGAGVAALIVKVHAGALGGGDDDDDPPRSTWAGTTRWIGHC